MMKLHIYDTREAASEAAAALIAETVQALPAPVLGLATGGTFVGVYAELVRLARTSGIDFSRATTFNLDEYAGLPRLHPQSYYSYMVTHLFGPLGLRPEQCHLPDGSAPDPADECARYDALLAQAGRIDLQLLGIGHNGHIGFNEPDHALRSGTHVVELKPETREANARFFASPEEVPTQALTMGIGSILQARAIALVAFGADKADILARALAGPITTDCPASLLQTHGDVRVFADAAAAAGLGALTR